MSEQLHTPIENGFEMAKYKWTQNARDVSLVVSLTLETKPKDIKINFTPNSISVKIFGDVIVEGPLLNTIKVETSTWYIFEFEGKKNLIVELDKKKYDEWWSCVVRGHTQIDTAKIITENASASDLDQETRMTIDKMLYDEKIKEESGYYKNRGV
jgi:hypothetical protein